MRRIGPLGWSFITAGPALLIVLLMVQQAPVAVNREFVLTILGIGVVGAITVLSVMAAAKSSRQVRLRDQGRCPECGYDLRASRGRCPECGTSFFRGPQDYTAPLRDEWPANPVALRKPEGSEHTVRVLIGWGGVTDDLLVEHLTLRGIACFVKQRKAPGQWRYRPAPWVKEVWVWSGDEQQATEIINRLVNPDGTPARRLLADQNS